MIKKYFKYIFVVFIFIFGLVTGILVQKNSQLAISLQNYMQTIPTDTSLPKSWKAKEGLPGNSFATALDLQAGYDTQGALNPGNILNYYKFTIPTPSAVLFTVTNVPQDFSFVVYDSSYGEIAHTYRYGSDSGSTKIKIQNPGKYYVKVFGNYNDVVNIPYTIRFSVQPFFE